MDSASVPESLNEAGLSEVLEPSESDTKKRRVECFDESVDWCQREKSSIAWMTNVSDEREVFEIDVGDPLEAERSFCVAVKEIAKWEIERGYLSPSPARSTNTIR